MQDIGASHRRVSHTLVDWRIGDLGLTNAKVAAFIGVSAGQFSRLKSGERNIGDERAHALAHVLRMPVEIIAPLSVQGEAVGA